MSDKTAIEWTNTYHEDGTVTAGSTWNPIRGQNARHTCARISPGCDNCYAATMTRRGLMGTAPIDYGTGETLNDPPRLDEKALLLPLTWKKPRKVFVCSMTDLFGTWVPDEWLEHIYGVMADTPQHTYIVLTKRPTRMRDCLTRFYQRIIEKSKVNHAAELLHIPDRYIDAKGFGLIAHQMFGHVWHGVTIESDQYAWRADRLRQTPAAVRWVSAEPLLSGLPSLNLDDIDWLVTGGESGPKARPSHPDWYRDLRDRSAASGTAFFHKQWGAHVWPSQMPDDLYRDMDAAHNLAGIPEQAYRVGNHRSGRLLDGVEHNAFPAPAVPSAGPGGAA